MRELTPEERRTYSRLRRAYRRAGITVVRRNGSLEDMRLVCQRITKHAISLGWLTAGKPTPS